MSVYKLCQLGSTYNFISKGNILNEIFQIGERAYQERPNKKRLYYRNSTKTKIQKYFIANLFPEDMIFLKKTVSQQIHC